jgi:hypothetical protein
VQTEAMFRRIAVRALATPRRPNISVSKASYVQVKVSPESILY